MQEAQPESTLSPEQQDTARLLNRLFGNAFADRYADFCALASGRPRLHASVPLAAHAMREFESMLRGTLVGPLEAGLPRAPADNERLDKAADYLRALGFDDGAMERALHCLRPRQDHAEEIKDIALRLGFAADSDVTQAWISLSSNGGRRPQTIFP